MYEDIYGELMIYMLMPVLFEEVYGRTDRDADFVFENMLPEAEQVNEAVHTVNVFEYYGQDGAVRKNSDIINRNERNVINGVLHNYYENAVNNAVQNPAEIYGGDIFGFYGGDVYESVYREERNSEKTAEKFENNSVFESISEVFGNANEHFESEKVFSEEKRVESEFYKNIGGEFERDFAKTAAKGMKTEEKSEKRNEFVINIGGITQNISGGGTETADIGEAVAKCLIEAVNTTAEGAF